MKQTRLMMGMPIAIEIVDNEVAPADFETVFELFNQIDQRYSTYKPNSEISRINAGLPRQQWSAEMRRVLKLCEQTKRQTGGYFDIKCRGLLDPSGLVKGWAIGRAAGLLKQLGYQNFYVDAGGDVQVSGHNSNGQPWRLGIRNPFDRYQNVKILAVRDKAVATSGTYVRGQHIYNPQTNQAADEVASVTVIGSKIYDADRFATAAFAMGEKGISWLENLPDFEAYVVKKDKTAVMTSGFQKYVAVV
ncbi:MAG: FAD:protein FMN transferase [Candidatus Saccharimonadales bacterium]